MFLVHSLVSASYLPESTNLLIPQSELEFGFQNSGPSLEELKSFLSLFYTRSPTRCILVIRPLLSKQRRILHFIQSKVNPRGDTPIMGHIRDVRLEWVSFPGRKPADGCKFLTKNLRMSHNFDIILPGNGWFSSKLNKTYCSLVNFYCK